MQCANRMLLTDCYPLKLIGMVNVFICTLISRSACAKNSI